MLKILLEQNAFSRKSLFSLSVIFVFFLTMGVTEAQVKLATVFEDSMVLQRDLPINIWGTAAKDEKIQIILNGKTYQGQANKKGTWLITLPAQQVATKQSLEIMGGSIDGHSIKLNNVAFGDVWLASGQSNMEFKLKEALKIFPQEDKLKQYPDIRQFKVTRNYFFKEPLADIEKGNWQVASKETVGNFSAVAWFFAKELYRRYQVPIGIISSSVGATPVESWMSYESLKNYPETQALAYKLGDDEGIKQLQQEYSDEVSKWLEKNTEKDKGLEQTKWFDTALDDSIWPLLSMPGSLDNLVGKYKNGVIWLRKDFSLSKEESKSDARLLLGKIVESDQTFINGIEVGRTPYRYSQRDYFIDSKLLKTGINNITIRIKVNRSHGGMVKDEPYKLVMQNKEILLSGDWKYQIGVKPKKLPFLLMHRTSLDFKPVGLFNAMIAPLDKMKLSGVIWYQGESNAEKYQGYSDKFSTMIKQWRELFKQPQLPFLFVQLANFKKPDDKPQESEWAELRAEQTKVRNTVENTAMALAIDVGERHNIHPLDKKTVGVRLALGARHIVYGEKQLNYTSPLVEQAILKNGRAIISFKHINKGLKVKGDKLMGFAIAGEDKKYIWANAKLANNQVIVWHDSMKAPKYVRYAWANNPEKANLFNDQGLPATPFTVELIFTK